MFRLNDVGHRFLRCTGQFATKTVPKFVKKVKSCLSDVSAGTKEGWKGIEGMARVGGRRKRITKECSRGSGGRRRKESGRGIGNRARDVGGQSSGEIEGEELMTPGGGSNKLTAMTWKSTGIAVLGGERE
jgi:hypothetical protein